MRQTSLCGRARWNALHRAFRGRIQCPSGCHIVCLCAQVGQRSSVTLSSLLELFFHVHSLYNHFHFVNSLQRWQRHLTFCSSRLNICVEQLPMLLEQMPTSVSTSLENEKVAASLNELIFDNDCGFLFDTGAYYLLPFLMRIDMVQEEHKAFFLDIR
ncbi:unnamed protein product, partial [Ixodes pacificus]